MKYTESDFAAAGERYLTEHAAYNLTLRAAAPMIVLVASVITIIAALAVWVLS